MTKLTLPPALPCSIKDKRKEINGGVGWDRSRKDKEQDVHLSSFCLWLYLYTLDTRRTGRPNFTFNTLKKKTHKEPNKQTSTVHSTHGRGLMDKQSQVCAVT